MEAGPGAAPGKAPAAVAVAVFLAGSVLVMDPGGWHPFGPSKWLAITVAASAAAAVSLRSGVHVHRPSLTGWLAFLAWTVIASFVALDPVSAWLGTPDRRLGVIGMTTLFAAYVGGMGVSTGGGRRLVARVAALTTSLAGVSGLLEVIGRPMVELTTTTDRISSTLGSPAYLGAALCLLIPLSAGLALDGTESGPWRMTGAVGTVTGVLLLAGSGTRAAAVGLAAAAVMLGSRRRGWLGRRAVWWAATALVVGTIVVVSPLGSRLLDPGSMAGRLAEWRVAGRVVVDRPLAGTGLEGYRIVFPEHVDVDYVREYGRATITDRAHSGPLDLGTTLGLPGVVAWFAAAVFLIGRSWHAMGTGDRVLQALGAAVAAVWFQELFLFPTLEVSAAAWGLAGVLVASSTSARASFRSRPLALVASILALAALVVGALDVMADHRAETARARQDPTLAEGAVRLRPDDFRYRLLEADLRARSGDLEGALNSVQETVRDFPGDPALRLAEARLLVATGVTESPAAVATRIGTMVEADPLHPELRLLHGEALAATGRAGEAERAFLAAAELSPDDATPYVRLASLYSTLGHPERARQAIDRAESIDPAHPDLEKLRAETGT